MLNFVKFFRIRDKRLRLVGWIVHNTFIVDKPRLRTLELAASSTIVKMKGPVKVGALCELCHCRKAVMRRPKNLQKLCKVCFIAVFEEEIHNTITREKLFHRGESVAIGASGGKDSTVLAAVMKTLNERYDYGLHLVLLSIDEGIVGYRDDSLATVKRNRAQYGMPLEIVSYKQLYDWTMDEIVACTGIKSSCTYCGVFRRQALDRGALKLGIHHIVTGHNADDMAETVLLNLLRGDTARIERSVSISTNSTGSPVKRSKPFKYAYEKEIVLYAHYRKLDYFSTECTYSPQAFRGTARTLLKNLESVRPSSILDIIRSGEQFRLKPRGKKRNANREMEVRADGSVSLGNRDGNRCERCGYLSTNRICKACILLEGLNKSRAKVRVEGMEEKGNAAVTKKLERLTF